MVPFACLITSSHKQTQPPFQNRDGGFFVQIFVLSHDQKEREITMSNTTIECPECAAAVPLPADAMANEIIACPDCGTELEILSLDPLEVDYAPEVEEDWGE